MCTKTIELFLNIPEFVQNKTKYIYDDYDYNYDDFFGMAFMTGLPVSGFNHFSIWVIKTQTIHGSAL